ncbi:MAG: 3-keto-5-aminohexanoate cleavage protein [Pseudomonadota bacterium]
MRSLPQIMVAPNGARLTKADHPNVPITHDEIVECASACFEAGADGIHAHIRDENGKHLLDADVYRRLVGALKHAVPDMAVQITTEAVGIYDAATQMKVALGSGAEMISASVREISRAGHLAAADFYGECNARGMSVQHILYDTADCELLFQTLASDDLTDPRLQVIFALGRYSSTGTSGPEELKPFLDWLTLRQINCDWAVCAFGQLEVQCLMKTVNSGGKCRVGFENSCFLSDGSIARGNPEKVTDLVEQLRP